jgi:UDP-glucose 4-epimerase
MSRLVLVTGGAGFIGSHLVDALLARGDRVRVVDDFSTGRRDNLAHCLADIELLEGDVRDPGLVARAVAGCDGVLHEAAVASVTQSLEDPVRCGSVTHGGTVNVLRLARRAGVAGFVLASSCAVYGDTDTLPVGEDTPPRPRSPYALAKLLSEGACRAQARGAAEGPSRAAERESAGIRTVCLRYFNVYGPRQDPSSEYSGVIARFMDVAVAARKEPSAAPPYVVYGDGRQSRDFVYVADVVAANLLALDACLGAATASRLTETPGLADEPGLAHESRSANAAHDGVVVNVGTGREVDLLTLAAEIERVSGGAAAPPLESVGGGAAAPRIEFRAAREGDIKASRADVALARRLLGYEPATGFADGLAATFAWYAEHAGIGDAR